MHLHLLVSSCRISELRRCVARAVGHRARLTSVHSRRTRHFYAQAMATSDGELDVSSAQAAELLAAGVHSYLRLWCM